jgi:collagen type VI alpha
MPFIRGTTNTADAIKYVHENMLTSRHGDRDDVANVIVVLTDGGSNDPAETAEQAFLVRRLVGDKLGSNR